MLSEKVHERQKMALMQAVVRSAVDNGLENSTARVIGGISGVNEVYIYRYFLNKDDLFAKTFDYADEAVLGCITENLEIMHCESMNFKMRCRLVFRKCWDFILACPDWLIFYVRYYNSLSFWKNSFEAHIKRYEGLLVKIKAEACSDISPEALLNYITDTLLSQARNQIMCPKDAKAAEETAFTLLYSVLERAFLK